MYCTVLTSLCLPQSLEDRPSSLLVRPEVSSPSLSSLQSSSPMDDQEEHKAGLLKRRQ